MRKIRLAFDLDDTSACFIGDDRHFCVPILPTFQDYPEMHKVGFFRNLRPMPGAIESIKKLIASKLFDIYIVSVPLHTSPHSYSEKIEWIHEHLPELSKKVILTQDKGMIDADYLVDDSIHWKSLWETTDHKKFIHFNPRKNPIEQWNKILDYFLTTYKK